MDRYRFNNFLLTLAAMNMIDVMWICQSEDANTSFPEERPNITCGKYATLCRDFTCSGWLSDCDGHGGRYCEHFGQRYCIHDGCKFRIGIDHMCDDYCKTCDDGSCSPDGVTCPGECPSHRATWCDGKCVRFRECKPDCPEYSCDDGRRCYTEVQKCTGVSHCNDDSDERDCPKYETELHGDGSFSEWLTFYVVCILIILVTVVSICAALIKRRRNPTYLSSDAECDDAIQVVDFTGTRLQPVDRIIHPTTTVGAAEMQVPMVPAQPTSPPPYSEVMDPSKYPAPPSVIGGPFSNSGVPSEPPPPYQD